MKVLLQANTFEDEEPKTAWFTLPIYDDELMEELGIETDSEEFTIKDSNVEFDVSDVLTVDELNDLYKMYEDLPKEMQEELEELLDNVNDLEELHNIRHDIILYSGCSNMADVAREYLNETGQLDALPEHLRQHFDYESYGEILEEDNTYIITNHGIFEMPY